jgi:hypothetical protein
LRVNRHAGVRRLVGVEAGCDEEGGVSRQLERSLAFILREAKVGDHVRRAGLEAAVDFDSRTSPLLEGHEVQSQQTGGCIERSLRRAIDIALMQTRARREWPRSLCGWLE